MAAASTSAADGSKKMIILTTSDSVDMPVEREVAERSILIKNLLEDLGGEGTEPIPIPNVCRICALLYS
jgi:S-phase kinase-associated protein 1